MDQDLSSTSQVTIDTRRSKRPGPIRFSEVLQLIPVLSSKGNFRLWSRSLRRALDSQNTEYWYILNEGPEHTCQWEERTRVSCTLLALVGARVDEELQSVIATAHTPRAAWELLKDHFTETDSHKAHPKYVQWIKCTYDISMSTQEFVDKWRLALKEVVEVSGTGYLPYHIRIHQFFAAVDINPAVAKWNASFKIDPTWSGSQALDNAFVHFIGFEKLRLPNGNKATRRDPHFDIVIKKKTTLSTAKKTGAKSLKRKASHIIFD
ncbi:hypothetical protein N7457_001302 [Penicillium paradoxum]|uniref:uncharacterized protein n=1 Tax=Penicillium paradoxum TaxID=176176 RepID=UPI002548DFF8|nr:uncharacterized protein N7457_001302 [Penicillium paradoxum]KAJ5794703.1 hypothetical protein N7457_001302 [Penicillium paradoxum]